MSEIPSKVTSSGLWQRVATDRQLALAIERLRTIVEILATKISEQIPEFTDHSVKHMDSLWRVTDVVLTKDEIARLTVGEAFVLGGALYLHDLGMAIAATPQGAQSLKEDVTYRTTQARLIAGGMEESHATILSLRHAGRVLHAKYALKLATETVPGLDRYIIEDSDIRSGWGRNIGQVSESHHWSLPEVDRILGSRGQVPDPLGDTVDLGYVACLLRIVDYAHINMDRASVIQRLLRPSIPPDSLKHWLAQENITGPIRESDQLVYGITKPIQNVEAWWVFFEMASGLDTEIAAVSEYLNTRRISVGRFSLGGVKGAKTPQTFAVLVQPQDFEPVDIRFRPDSMERLVHILGGRTLYGDDHFAPIRELLQNARDAIALHQATIGGHGGPREDGHIYVGLEKDGERWTLVVSDNGVGMSAHVVTTYLLGIAADYWNSADFFSEYSAVSRAAFQPVGHFGIGFLSVFMLGDHVELQTQRRSGQNLILRLHGIGQRGALVKRPPVSANGTSVRVRIAPRSVSNLGDLAKIVLAKAPMLSIPMTVNDDRGLTEIQPGWWRNISQQDLSEFLDTQSTIATTPTTMRDKRRMMELRYTRSHATLTNVARDDKWPGKQPELLSENSRILAIPGVSHILLCSKGFAVASVHIPGLLGMVDIGDLELNAARSQPLGWNADQNQREWLAELRPYIVAALDSLEAEGDIPARFKFLITVARNYGNDLLLETKLPWVSLRAPPGNLRLIPFSELVKRVAEVREVLIAYGRNNNPWNAEAALRRRYPDASRSALILPVSDDGQPNPGSYNDRQEIFTVDLQEHFNVDNFEHKSLPQALLLVTTLKAVQIAWSITDAQINGATWTRYEQTLYGRLLRPDTVDSIK